PYAKGFGKMLNVNCSFIILPVLRNILCWLRSTPVADIIPLNDNIKMHKIVFGFTAFGGLAHATLHYLNFAWAHQRFGESIAKQALGNLVGITGHLISFIMLLMAITAFFNRKLINCFGRRFDGYRTFLLVHKLWIPCFVFLWLHGPQFWAFSIWPLLLMGMEKMVQTSRARVDVAIVEAKIVGRDVLALKMKLQSKRKFVYKAGEYLYLNCPQIAELEWHPFTISSAPEDAYFSCHIRCRPDMDWCFQLRTLLGLASSDKAAKPTAERSLVRLRVDGPYGSPSEEVFDHDTVVLVGAGIGVTPFISILKSISIRARQREIAGSMDNLQQQSLKVYFYWICRDEQEFHSFKDLIDAVIDSADLKDSLQVNTYTTGVSVFIDYIALRRVFLTLGLQELNLKQVKLERYNQYSGKPNWGRILKEIAGDHQGEEIGVFLCGPPALARELQASCKRQNQTANKLNSKTIFKFHKESF
ncbi:ferric reductase NAD binding domain-containing protein, partial [Gaertneriomyces semiglobifer]